MEIDTRLHLGIGSRQSMGVLRVHEIQTRPLPLSSIAQAARLEKDLLQRQSKR